MRCDCESGEQQLLYSPFNPLISVISHHLFYDYNKISHMFSPESKTGFSQQ